VKNAAPLLAAAALAACLAAAASAQTPLGTAFSYQGQLRLGGSPYTGTADFVFRLFDAPTAGNQVGLDAGVSGVTVAGGNFTTLVDFGAVFDGNECWLEIDVMTPGDAGFTTLAPRHLLAPTPYAVRALSGPSGSSQWNDGASGIDYAGNVGIGSIAGPGVRLLVDGGTNAINPLVVTNNHSSYGALAVRNDAVDGYGLYDAWSDRHHFAGKVGIGTVAPESPLHVVSNYQGVTVSNTGVPFQPGYSAAIVALGYEGLFSTNSIGVYAASTGSRGVWGISASDLGVVGDNSLYGNSGWLGGLTEGVYGQATHITRYGGRFTNTVPGGVALRVDGTAQVRALQLLGADLAETFAVRERQVEPGTVLMLDEHEGGRLRIANQPYSARVAGVVSGANGLDAGVVLHGDGFGREDHAAVALSGRVWVRCDATREAIRTGDLLTTAERPGYAMRASDRSRAFGATLGKAMTSLDRGTGMVLVLVSLQ